MPNPSLAQPNPLRLAAKNRGEVLRTLSQTGFTVPASAGGSARTLGVLRPEVVSDDYVSIKDLAKRLGMDRSHARRYVMRLGYSFDPRRTPGSGSQLTLTAWPRLPVPGPVVGMVLLFVGLLLRGGVGDGRVVDGLLSQLPLLFVPAGVGIMLHVAMLREAWLAISVAPWC